MELWGRTGIVTVVVLTAACSPSGGVQEDPVEARLPTVVNAPGSWSDDEGTRGPVAAVGIAARNRPRGVFDAVRSYEFFTVSATDGLGSWLQPRDSLPAAVGETSALALSPDGRWIAWTNDVPAQPAAAPPFGSPFELDGGGGRWEGWLDGWSVMDTGTGDVRELVDPDFSRVRDVMSELVFSADSRYLVTSYAPPRREGAHRTRGHQLVAWDVEEGTHVVLEEPGEHPLPHIGSAPSGVVWSRGQEVFRADPATGERVTVTLPRPVTVASWGPEGSFAFADGGSALHVGRSVEEAIEREVDLPGDGPDPRRLSWQDPTHVVVDRWRPWVDRVDLQSRTAERVELEGYGEILNAPELATALWQQPLREPLDPVGTADPRAPWRWGVLVVVLLLGLAYVVRRVRVTPA